MSDDKKQFVKELPKQYDASSLEDKWYGHWEGTGLFGAAANPDKKPYTIVIPPPNVTGVLHMGHALNNTLQDVLVRYRRMTGREALWVPGTDHAGIATQNVVERSLAKDDTHREDIGREAFIEKVWEWKEEYGGTIVKQLRKLGSSCDWERERFTMDEGLSHAVREVFVRLYEDGLIYRGRRLINWCVRCHSALADDEVEHEDKPGHLWHIRYPLKEGNKNLIVATTRPETMLGDTAIAVHPEDERYQKLIGSTVVLPVVGREIPIIADDMVDPAFGTGVVKVTPAHDPNDYECGLRHELEQIIVIGPDGTMTGDAGKYEGLDRFRCRELLVEELEESKLLEKTEEHGHAVGHCYRCSTVVEPYLSEQWFVKMKPLAEKALEASRKGEVQFHPARWEKVYLSWLENVRDWCISRQIWWGHRLPVWYCDDCEKISVAREDITACSHCSSENIRQDEDVLDTWFSSALWPFSTLGWPEDTPDLKYFYPTDTLVTARDIIYFWVARMVMMGLHFREEVPFSHVYIHGNILDAQGRRMSKSLGNGINPLELIEQYGADAVRYTLTALTTEGQDIKLAPTRFEMGRNFINKLWNASRFCLMNLAEVDGGSDVINRVDLEFEDRWILSRFAEATAQTTQSLDGYRYADTASAVRDFAWHDLCDWYLEIVKGRFREGGKSAVTGARVLALMLDSTLRLLHPLLPFITEEIWSLLAKVAPARGLGASPEAAPENLIRAAWPTAEEGWRDEGVETEMKLTQEVIRAIRNVRAKFKLSPKKELSCTVSAENEEISTALNGQIPLIQRLANTTEVELTVGGEKPAQAAAEVMDGVTVYVPLAGLMDVDLERQRLETDLKKKKNFLEKSVRKLHNEEFTSRAKPEVVQRERDLKTDLEGQIAKIQELIASLEG
ncbi:MAG: valine--tRNA ligase [Planctomycetota bacterium]|jgi:valyl-tRNA synthetase